jgi:CheY-like chemotaxis protein
VGGMEDLLKRALGPGVRIAQSLPIDLAPVRVDANQLELALLNLAVNARDAMPLGGALTIAACHETVSAAETLRGLAGGDYVRISVSDTGVGMDEPTLAKATEPFFTTKGPGKGTGLGLSMVHGLAAQSGGALTLSSQPGTGTTVDLWLPRAEPDGGMRVVALDERCPEGVRAHPRTVLVVDDDPLVSTGTAAMLEDLGHVALEANSGVQALEVLRSDRRVDVVLTDHAMPGMTGMELARQIRGAYPGLVIILARGYADLPGGGEEELGLPRLSKPYRLEHLAAALATTVGPVSAYGNVIPLRAG